MCGKQNEILHESREADTNEAPNTAQKGICNTSSDAISDLNLSLHLFQAIAPGVKNMHDRPGHLLVDMDQLTNIVKESPITRNTTLE
eukprot:4377250-Ditylum_brightwellii.AAC.1